MDRSDACGWLSLRASPRGTLCDHLGADRSISEFREYILIDQSKYHLEQYAKNSENQWLFTEHDSENAVLTLASVEVKIPLSELYEEVDFSEIEE